MEFTDSQRLIVRRVAAPAHAPDSAAWPFEL
jgi:hypothetical protein